MFNKIVYDKDTKLFKAGKNNFLSKITV